MSSKDPANRGVTGALKRIAPNNELGDGCLGCLGVVIVGLSAFIWWNGNPFGFVWVLPLVWLFSVLRRELRLPRPVLATSSSVVHAGEEITVEYRLEEGADRASSFVVSLTGEEYASHHFDHDETYPFFERELLTLENPEPNAHGTISVTIPWDVIPTLELPNCSITWHLAAKVRGKEERHLKFPIVIEPVLRDAKGGTPQPETVASPCIKLSQTDFKPGDLVEGTLLLAELRSPLPEGMRAVRVRLVWYTDGIGSNEKPRRVVGAQSVAIDKAPDPPFALRVPRRPYSFTGKTFSIVWAVEVEALGIHAVITVSPQKP